MTALDQLPEPGDRNMALRVTRDAERWLKGGSPWLFDGSIESQSFSGAPGDLAIVFDHDRDFLAIGLYDPTSPIRVKVLHAGKPVPVDAAFWRDRLAVAIDRRATLADSPDTTGYRLVHGENDRMPGLVVDRYDDTLVVKLYSPVWFAHLQPIVDELLSLTEATRIVLRLGRSVAAGDCHGLADGDVIAGDAPDGPIEFLERGIRLEADVVSGQKTGHFLDQRDNRHLVRGLAASRTVLDVFSSTGGFSVAAAAAGAASVHLIDQSAPAIAAARRNLARNRDLVAGTGVTDTVGDAFAELERLAAAGTTYDLVIVDPPSFAQNQAAVPGALHAYRRLAELAVAVLEPGGTLVQCSCSSRVPADEFFDAVYAGARSAGRPLREQRRTFHAIDHPIGFEHGAYLKALFATG